MTASEHFPYIVARGLYCLNSRFVAAIVQLPEHQPLPEAPEVITGIFPLRGEMISMFDFRTALHLPTMNQEYERFVQMLDARKQDHVRWVDALEESVHTGSPFTLATDPHKCALGLV